VFNIDKKHFNIEQIFECGQCFRWERNLYGGFTGVVQNEVINVYTEGNKLFIVGSLHQKKWIKYFDLLRDYKKIKEILEVNLVMKKCIKKGYGIRILQQDFWETIISFIISANNNIPRIKKIILKFCEYFGEEIETPECFCGKKYYSFPKIETIANLETKDLAPISAGFRDKYIIQTARKILKLKYEFCSIERDSNEDIFQKLLKLNGVGEKISNCVLLFSFARYEAFPQDVWINRIMESEFGISKKEVKKFVVQKFGNYAGIAQQYLYYYFKKNKVITKV
jgi:N-glycosylase/DNA lyase